MNKYSELNVEERKAIIEGKVREITNSLESFMVVDYGYNVHAYHIDTTHARKLLDEIEEVLKA